MEKITCCLKLFHFTWLEMLIQYMLSFNNSLYLMTLSYSWCSFGQTRGYFLDEWSECSIFLKLSERNYIKWLYSCKYQSDICSSYNLMFIYFVFFNKMSGILQTDLIILLFYFVCTSYSSYCKAAVNQIFVFSSTII